MINMNLDGLKELIKKYGMKPLAEKAGISRTSLYNLVQGENFESETLEKISNVLNVQFGFLYNKPELEDICNHLAFYGAPLAYDKGKEIQFSLEESIKWGLHYSLLDGMIDSLMPYIIVLNFNKINLAKLLSKLDQENQIQLFGYYLELAADYSKNKKMKNFANMIHSSELTELQMGNEKLTKRMQIVLKNKDNSFAKKWNILTLNSSSEYFDRFRKWDKVV